MRKLGSLRLPPTLLGSRYGLSQERKNLLTGSPYNLTEEQIPILLDLIKERMIVSDDKEGHPPNNQEALYILVDTYLDWFDREYLENEIPASAYGLIRDALTEGWDISEEACAKHWENRFAEEYYDLKNAVEG